MGMFETRGQDTAATDRKPNTLRKLERMNKALRHEEPDRVPISDFFWGSFIRRWRQELNLPADANPYYHYDLDWIVTVPNMDPHIRAFETLQEDEQEVVVRTGFEAVLRKRFDLPMPESVSWETDTIEKLEAFEFDDPRDPRRYFSAGDNQIAGVGDGFERNSPAWIETVKSLRPDFPGLRQHDGVRRVPDPADRPGEHDAVDRRVSRADGRADPADRRVLLRLLQGRRSRRPPACWTAWSSGATWPTARRMFFSPDYWRTYFKPCVKAMIELCHAARPAGDLPRLRQRQRDPAGLHRDGPRTPTIRWRPRPDLDAVELRRQYGHRLGFCGNSDIRSGRAATGSGSAARCCGSSTRPRAAAHLPVRPFGRQRRVRPHLRLHRPAGPRVRPVSARSRRIQ